MAYILRAPVNSDEIAAALKWYRTITPEQRAAVLKALKHIEVFMDSNHLLVAIWKYAKRVENGMTPYEVSE